PLTVNGKVNLKSLPSPNQMPHEVLRAYVAPRNDAEEIMCGIWCDLLNIEKVGIFDDFFEIGGHSLMATRLVSRIRENFRIEVPLSLLFTAPTIAGLITLMAEQIG